MKYYRIELLVLSLLIYLVIFLKLDSFHMRWWDESMFAVNAYEMIQNGKFFAFYFDNAPDLFNSKPPLTVWLQVIFIKLLGYNELAIRLPSAIASALVVWFVFDYLFKNHSRFWAWSSALILLTSYGFIGFHGSRTGDSDALLTLFLLLGNLSFLKFLNTLSKRHIFYFLIFITLAFHTKLYAALLFCPAYLLLLIQSKQLKNFLNSWQFLLGLVLFLATTTLIIFLREQQTPGYLNVILFNDAGRLFNKIEDHQQSYLFYFEQLFVKRFSFWAILLIIGVVLGIFSKDKRENNIITQCMVLVLSYLLIITISSTKLEWYDLPLYPLLAIVAGFSLFKFSEMITLDDANRLNGSYVILALVFLYPYILMFNKSQANVISPGEKKLEACERFIFKKTKENYNLNGVCVYHHDYNGSLLFYKYKLKEKGQTIRITNVADFQENEKVLVSNDSLKEVLHKMYDLEEMDGFDYANLFRVEGKK